MSKIVVLDYGSSNLHSIVRALEFVADKRHRIIVTDQQQTILAADRVIFPGQGAVGQCMKRLQATGLDEVIKVCATTKPFLGICLGLQSLMQISEEDGGVSGLSIIEGRVVRFADHVVDNRGAVCKVPHMGWNQVCQQRVHPLWSGIEDASRFYFAHSYYVITDNNDDIVGKTDHITEFAAAVARDNIFAIQFHPEKSQQAGLILLRNFLSWDGCSLI